MCGSAPAAPQLPQYPGLSPEEQKILDKEGLTLDQFNQLIQGSGTSLAQNKNVLQQISGLYDSQGNIDQKALADLKARTSGQLSQSQDVGSAALGYLKNYFGGSGTPGDPSAPGTGSVAQTQSDVYKAALEGTGAVNAATTQKQARDFLALKDSLAQRGIMVNGDTVEKATSDSTAGQRAIQLFQQNIAAENSQERLGYIQTLGGQVAGTVGAAGGASTAGTNATATQMGYTTGAATQDISTLAPMLAQYQQGLSMNYQPYYMQQQGVYQQQMAQAQANYQAGMNQFNNIMNQRGMLTPSASFMGFGVNPHASQNGSSGASSMNFGGGGSSGGGVMGYNGGGSGISYGGTGTATA